MKNNYSLILNAILVVAVAVLFYLHFNSDLSSSLATSDDVPTIDLSKKAFSVPKNLSTSRVLYVNIDSVGVKYEAYADLSLETNAKANALQNQYQKLHQFYFLIDYLRHFLNNKPLGQHYHLEL